MKAPVLNTEAARMQALRQYQILDTDPEAAFDDLTQLAAQVCDTPVAWISLLDSHRQWFKSKLGIAATEIDRNALFSTDTVSQTGILVVQDVLADERSALNLQIFSQFRIRAYGGVPLLTPEGHVLGTLAVADYVPRQLQPEQIEGLQRLGRQVMAQLELRRSLTAHHNEELEWIEQSSRTALSEHKRVEVALQQQTEREQLVSKLAKRIRLSLNLAEILNTTVFEVRQFLQTERVFIYRFEPDWSGVIAVEAVDPSCSPILGTTIKDSFFGEVSGRELYKQGRIQAIEDIYTVGLSKCHVDLLARLQVRANLIVPILQEEKLWGLLVANHCSGPRQWQQLEIDLLKQLSIQVAIALHQAELYQQVQTELRERQQAEQKIREQAALLDITTDAIVVRDLSNKILFWNKSAERLYGWKAEEALERDANELLFKETSPQLQAAQQTVIEQGEWQGELYKVAKSGKQLVVESCWTLVYDEQKQPKSILTVDTDITEKKQLEVQFLRAQRIESIGTLAGGIAHDLNNMLTPILMSVQLLQKKLPDEQSQRLLKTLETNTKRGANLVRQVLSFARGIEGTRATLQVGNLLLEIGQIIKETFPRSIEIQTDIPANLWLVSADVTQLHQVFMNLCLNARDAISHSGLLNIAAENLSIDESYARMNLEAKVGPYVVVTVTDTGGGIPPEVLDRVFEPFFTTKELGQGTGLGLSTAMGIIKSHGGFVKVDSELGKGTQFKVYLPAVASAVVQQVEDYSFPEGQGELILVVDDEVPIQNVTQSSLEAYNYRVLTAIDGIEAITLYAQHKDEISLVLIDMMMPLMDGVTTIRTLQKINSQVKIVAMSGLVTSDKRAELACTGTAMFLPKPFTAKQLLETLHQVLYPEFDDS